MKGIVLAAGKGTRLAPTTLSLPKPLLPLYDKPQIYYPLSLLITAGIKDILIITSPRDQQAFITLLGNGSHLGVNFSYQVQTEARGIADAFLVGEEFIGCDSVMLALADNIFYDNSSVFNALLSQATALTSGGLIFALPVDDPRPFGVLEFDSDGRVIGIEEKPDTPKSNYIIPGLYCYDNQVSKLAKELHPSARGELEITALNNVYLEQRRLNVLKMPQSMVWLDAGTPDSMLEASVIVRNVMHSEHINIGCIEEAAYLAGNIDLATVHAAGEQLKHTIYGQYLLSR